MGHTFTKNPEITHPQGHAGAQDPSVVMARDQSLTLDDPYRVTVHQPDDTVCSRCDAVVRRQRWSLDPERKALVLSSGPAHEVLCPACRRVTEQVPEGIVTLSGDFWPAHRDEILHHIRNAEVDALGTNPLSSIADIHEVDGTLQVFTTTEKLAQRIGRSLQKAYSGKVQFVWSDGRKLVRVTWERNL